MMIHPMFGYPISQYNLLRQFDMIILSDFGNMSVHSMDAPAKFVWFQGSTKLV